MARRKNLPIEIVEKIIAMMPYPSIFKCKCLSKSWLARFASISSEANKAKKGNAISFQKQVGEWSNSWKTLCPVFAKNNRDFIAYDRVCHKWRRLPSLPLPEANLYGKRGQMQQIQLEGALVYAFYPDSIESEKYIANILTGAWKQVPGCPIVGMKVLMERLVSCASSELYKVILLCLCRGGGRQICDIGQHELYVQIYDSKLDTWRIRKVVFSCALKTYDFEGNGDTMYLNGVLYFLATELNSEGIQLNFEEGTLEKLDMQPAKLFYPPITNRRMAANWNGILLLVLGIRTDRLLGFGGPGLQVHKFDFQLKELSEFAECYCPHRHITRIAMNLQPVCDGHCIFFGVNNIRDIFFGMDDSGILTYDVDKNDWSCLPIPAATTSYRKWDYRWVGSVFQPGLNPFAAV